MQTPAAATGTLLVVDADERTQRRIAGCAATSAFAVIRVYDARAALAVYAATSPEAVVLAGPLDGPDVACLLEAIRRSVPRPSLVELTRDESPDGSRLSAPPRRAGATDRPN